jgi:hypothetical protein
VAQTCCQRQQNACKASNHPKDSIASRPLGLERPHCDASKKEWHEQQVPQVEWTRLVAEREAKENASGRGEHCEGDEFSESSIILLA